MKKTILIILAIIIAAVGYFSSSRDSLKGKIITVAFFNYPPYQIFDKNSGKYSGFYVDLLEAIGKDQDLTFKYLNTGFKKIFTELPKGKYDMAFPITITPEREKLFEMTWPVFKNALFIFVPDGENTIQSIDDLKNKIVGAVQGVEGDFCQQLEHEGKIKKSVRYESLEQMHLDLADHKIDAIIDENVIGKYFQYILNLKIKMITPINFYEYTGFPVQKGNHVLRKRLNQGIKNIISTGEYVKIYRKDLNIEAQTHTDLP